MEKFLLVIGNKNYSSWSLRPWLVLKFFKIPFKEMVIPLYQAQSKAHILRYSPSGKVPLLIHGKNRVWDSMAIGEYLAEIFPRKGLWPKDRAARALARSISAEMHSGFIALRKNCPMDVRSFKPLDKIPLEVEGDVRRIRKIWDSCRSRFGAKGAFLFGAFSLADAMYAPIVWRFQTYGIKLSGLSDEYGKMMRALPAMREWQKAGEKESWRIGH